MSIAVERLAARLEEHAEEIESALATGRPQCDALPQRALDLRVCAKLVRNFTRATLHAGEQTQLHELD